MQMKEEHTYHIDVTEEENSWFQDKTNKTKHKSVPKPFWKVFSVVLGLHLAIAGGIGCTTLTARALDNKFTGDPDPNNLIPTKEPQVASTSIDEPKLTPTPQPTPQSTPKVEQAAKQTVPIQPQRQKYTTEYTIKKGDTINSIAKKYKLNTNRLLKINNIKDPNKIVVGQKLKFL